jgi:hypothetical protein
LHQEIRAPEMTAIKAMAVVPAVARALVGSTLMTVGRPDVVLRVAVAAAAVIKRQTNSIFAVLQLDLFFIIPYLAMLILFSFTKTLLQ